jgi:hypothetical protein
LAAYSGQVSIQSVLGDDLSGLLIMKDYPRVHAADADGFWIQVDVAKTVN